MLGRDAEAVGAPGFGKPSQMMSSTRGGRAGASGPSAAVPLPMNSLSWMHARSTKPSYCAVGVHFSVPPDCVHQLEMLTPTERLPWIVLRYTSTSSDARIT